MKLAKKLSKKIVSVTLCTMFLSAGSLQSLTNVSHALTTTDQTSEKSEILWQTDIFFKLYHRMIPTRKTFARVHLTANKDETVKMEYVSTNNNTPLSQLLLDDEYLVGFNSLELYLENQSKISTKWIVKNSSTSGTHAYMSTASSLKDLIDKFNHANVKVGDCIFMHGIKYDDTVTFSNDKITRPSSKGYSSGYKSRGINKWYNGF